MNVLDLFSGIGGFSLGLERAGMRTVAFCEIDPYCRRVLAKHWPDVPCYDDVTTLTAARLAADGIIEAVPDANCAGRKSPWNGFAERTPSSIGECGIDLICGGFPCQDISTAGKGAGIGGARSGLWSELARIIGEVRPRYVIVENVAALLGRGLERVLGDLAALGFDAEWHCVPASAVGAPHRRDRVWIVAYAASAGQRSGTGDQEIDRGNGGQLDLAGSWHDATYRREAVADAARNGWGERIAITDTGSSPPCRERTRQSGGTCSDVSHTNRAGREQQRWGVSIRAQLACADWWRVEPRLGFSSDGLSPDLDGGRINADAAEERSAQDLYSLREAIDAQTNERQIGGSERVPPSPLLRSNLHGSGLCQRHAIQVGLVQASDEIPWGLLRTVWGYEETTRTSYRREQAERLASEYPDLVRQLSHFAPPPCPTCWRDGSWEIGLNRVAHKVPARVDRLRSLGNAVVPQIPEIIGRAIMSAHA